MKSKIVLMIGSHMRHFYLADKLYKEGRLSALVVQEREEFLPEPPEYLEEQDRENFILHFTERDKAEKKFFGSINHEEIKRNVPTLCVKVEERNSEKVVEFIRQTNADMLLAYGPHILSNEIIECYEDKAFNIHGGLSPWYKGAATMFWPFYFMKPNQAGMTIHRLAKKIDAGDILHHSVPKLEYGDKLHEVACKALVQVAEDLCKILEKMDEGAELICVAQRKTGKLFLEKDWTPQTLRMIYNVYKDNLVDLYLDGKLEKDNLSLVNFFDNNHMR